MTGEGGRGRPPGREIPKITETKNAPETEQSSDLRIAVLRRVKRLADFLERQHAEEILDLVRDINLTYLDIAKRFVSPETAENYPEICRSAVREVVRRLMPPEEVEKLTYERRSTRLKAKIANDPESHRKQSHDGAVARNLKGPPDFAKMNEARGVIPWQPGERELLFNLIDQPEFQHGPGTYAGRPDYKKIAAELNQVFHSGEPVREQSKLNGVVVSDRYDQRTGRNKKGNK